MQFAAYQQPPRIFASVDAFDLQHQEFLQLNPSAAGEFFYPGFEECLEHALHVMVAQAGAPPDFSDSLMFIQ
jgi:hypothetical protein